jgi:hypothetical protein
MTLHTLLTDLHALAPALLPVQVVVVVIALALFHGDVVAKAEARAGVTIRPDRAPARRVTRAA